MNNSFKNKDINSIEMDTKVLQRLGFTRQEIDIYLVLLKRGSTSASAISKDTDIDRATCYRYLDNLQAKGAASYVVRNNVKYFQAAHPEKLLKDLKEKENDLKALVPDLVALTALPRDDTIVEVFTGIEGLKTVTRDILRSKEDHDVLGDEGHFLDIMLPFFLWFLRECQKIKVRERVLCSEKSYRKVSEYDYRLSETRTLPYDYILPTTTLITKSKVIIFNWKPPYHAIVIANKDMAAAHKNYFEVLWKDATRYPKKIKNDKSQIV